MPAITSNRHSSSRALIILGAVAGILAASAAFLWARYGTAVFHEMIVAGIALCF